MLAELRQFAGEEFVDNLIDVFLVDGPERIADMEAALEALDLDAFRRNAHSLKSNADTFGADDLAASARELEAMARAGTLPSGDDFAALREAYRQASAALEGMRE
ncbi:MAG: Hpt domain-containing protein [Gemmatimonadaceae bacterium]